MSLGVFAEVECTVRFGLCHSHNGLDMTKPFGQGFGFDARLEL